ncbi:MAG: GTPase, partial [Patescibacteria group bacterium]
MSDIPIIAIVGRPNVGKSTLFNRIIGTRYAITSPIPGTTRDRITYTTKMGPYFSVLVDTGGLEFDKKTDIEEDVQTQAKIAISEADLIYFVVDASAELTSTDFDAAALLRKTKKSVFLVANKCDKKNVQDNMANLYELGFGDFFEVSAIQDQGIENLQSKTAAALKKQKYIPFREKRDKSSIALCFLGRPNVGKSSLVNALLGEERVIVSSIP